MYLEGVCLKELTSIMRAMHMYCMCLREEFVYNICCAVPGRAENADFLKPRLSMRKKNVKRMLSVRRTVISKETTFICCRVV